MRLIFADRNLVVGMAVAIGWKCLITIGADPQNPSSSAFYFF